MQFAIVTPNAPFVVDADGEVTTAGVFRGLSGNTLSVTVRAFDNLGQPPSHSTPGTMTVSELCSSLGVGTTCTVFSL